MHQSKRARRKPKNQQAPGRSPPAPFCFHIFECGITPLFLIILQGWLLQQHKTWKADIDDYPAVLHPPYNPKIGFTLLMAIATLGVGMGCTILICFSQCTPLVVNKVFWACTILCRLSLMGVLIALIVLQTDFMPRPIGSCANDSRWPKGSGVSPSIPTIWEILPSHNVKSYDRNGYVTSGWATSCMLFVGRWHAEIVLAVAYFVSAVLAAVMLYYVFKPVKRDYPHGNKKYRIHRWAERHLFWVENRQSRRDAENEGPDL